MRLASIWRALRSGAALAALCCGLALTPACFDAHTWVAKEKPWTQGTIAGADQVRVERSDHGKVTLEHPKIGRDERGEYLAGRARELGSQEIRVDLSDILTLEAREVETEHVATGVAVGLFLAAALVLFLLHGSAPLP